MATDNKKTKTEKTDNTKNKTTKTKSNTSKASTTKKVTTKKTATKKESPKKTSNVNTKPATKKATVKTTQAKKTSTTKSADKTATKNKKTVSATTKKKASYTKKAKPSTASKKATNVTVKMSEDSHTYVEEITPEIVKELHVTDETTEIKKEEKSTVESKRNAYELTSFLGAELSIEKTKEAKKSRKGHYLKDAAFFATIVSVLDLLAMLFIKGYPQFLKTTPWINYTVTVIIDFVLVFLFTYLLDYLIVEGAVQKNNL